eukprot:2888249-Pleurochrysis_carterae.AAC.3
MESGKSPRLEPRSKLARRRSTRAFKPPTPAPVPAPADGVVYAAAQTTGDIYQASWSTSVRSSPTNETGRAAGPKASATPFQGVKQLSPQNHRLRTARCRRQPIVRAASQGQQIERDHRQPARGTELPRDQNGCKSGRRIKAACAETGKDYATANGLAVYGEPADWLQHCAVSDYGCAFLKRAFKRAPEPRVIAYGQEERRKRAFKDGDGGR